MIIHILHSNDLTTFKLPKEVSGTYLLSDKDNDGKTRVLINIASSEGKWYFNSNQDIKLIEHNTTIERKELIPYNYYTLLYYEKEYILLYVLPSFEDNYLVKEVKNDCSIVIGSDSECDIVYREKTFIAPKHFELSLKDKIWSIKTLDSKKLLYVNKKIVQNGYLNNYDRIFIMGLTIIIINNTLFFSCPQEKLFFKSEKFKSPAFYKAMETKKTSEIANDFYTKNDYFYTSPIFKQKFDGYKTTIIPPTKVEENSIGSIFSSVIPSALMSITSFISLYYTIKNYDGKPENQEYFITSMVMSGVFLLTGLVWPFIESIASTIRYKLNKRRKTREYKKYLIKKEEELDTILGKEKNILMFNNISLDECKEAIEKRNPNLFSKNIENESFLNIKFGTGKIKSKIEIDYSKQEELDSPNKMYDKIDRLIKKYEYIEDGDVIIPLRNMSLAVLNEKGQFDKFENALLLQLISLHDYVSLKIVVLTKENSNLNIIRNLNHCWNDERTFRYFATNLHEGEMVSSEIMKTMERMNFSENIQNTYFMIISDCIEQYKGLKIIDYSLKKKKSEENIFSSLLIFTDRVFNVPTGCNYFINYNEEESTFFTVEMDENKILKFKPLLMNGNINYYNCIEELSNIPIKYNKSDSNLSAIPLPTKLGFLEMYGIGKIELLNILERWKTSPISSSLAAPIGIDTNGDILSLDLHEKKHGPHGLIAGMTGSGKSEFIVTYIMSLAVNYSPDEVQFVLIDYKGGGLAGAFENRKANIKLPHLVGTITNLDKTEMNRTLVSIKSELQRRQKVFNNVKETLNLVSIDIYKYQMLVREKTITEPMSHLFIICDEFAELKAQQPDFMDELVSAARIGRSLGVHLILATQKPSGVVDDQIWSNAKFKVCCKVQTADDSNEMIRKPDAAFIKESGRFYLQVGYDEYYVLGQSAYTGVQYTPSDVKTTNVDNTILFLDNCGDSYRNVTTNNKKKSEEENNSQGEELSNILNYIIKLAKDNNYKNHQLWLDNIPTRLYYKDLAKKYSNIKSKAYMISPVIGEYDDPNTQSQGCVNLNITGAGNTAIIGNSSSGKCTLLLTTIFSTIINHSNQGVNFYIIDFGSEKFNVFRQAPHVGDILSINDKEKISYLFYMIKGEVERRQKHYAAHGGDFLIDAKNGKSNFPNIIVIIYGIEIFREMYDEIYDSLFLPVIRISSKVGIEFIVTASESTAIGMSLETNIKQYVLLHLSDESDYSYLLKGHAPANNPGRGIIIQNGKPVEFQTAIICDELMQKDYIEKIVQKLRKLMPKSAKRVPDVPKKVSIGELLPRAKILSEVPIGVNVITAQRETYDFTKKITLLSSASIQNTAKFFEKISIIISNISKTKLIIFNAEKEFNFKVNELTKYYDESFADIVKLFYSNCQKINNKPSDNNFVIIMIGYSKINNHLKKLKEEDADVKTLDDLILVSKNDNFKFVIFDTDNNANRLAYSRISELIDVTYGIWIGVDFDGQNVFDMQNFSTEINVSNEMVLLIKDSNPSLVKYPTI